MKKPNKGNAANTLEIALQPGKTEARVVAELATGGVATNAVTMQRFAEGGLGTVSLTELVATLSDSGKAVNANNLAHAEQVLNAQAITLNLMFAELARRAALNMGEHLGATETYMRLALRAQNQSRATFETLAAIKNPPLVFAKQMNVANGPQQVNNQTDGGLLSRASEPPAGAAAADDRTPRRSARGCARA
jgi:hypothetical protein